MGSPRRDGAGATGRKITDTGRGFSTLGMARSGSSASSTSVPIVVDVEVMGSPGTVGTGSPAGGDGRTEVVVVVVEGARTVSP